MTDTDIDAWECSHGNLQHEKVDTDSVPVGIYNVWRCEECGASLAVAYENAGYQVVFPEDPNADPFDESIGVEISPDRRMATELEQQTALQRERNELLRVRNEHLRDIANALEDRVKQHGLRYSTTLYTDPETGRRRQS